MTVAELIAELQKFPPNAIVKFTDQKMSHPRFDYEIRDVCRGESDLIVELDNWPKEGYL